MSAERLFDQIVFSGGGTRCFWQGGFCHVLRDEIPLHPARLTGVSGGALTAVGFVSHRGIELRETMIAHFAENETNLPTHEPFDDEPGNSPHQRIYRDVVDSVIDAEAQRLVAEGPQLQILIARAADDDWAMSHGAAMTMAYVADCTLRSDPHLSWPEAGGLTGELVDARAAAREGTLVDLICAAATIPPAFEPPTFRGRPAIDAGMIDQAPMPDPDEGTTLILLTKQFRNLPKIDGRIYYEPSRDVPTDKIDFTDPGAIRETWALGENDARYFIERIKNHGSPRED